MLKHYIHCHQAYDMLKGGSVGYISSLFSAFTQYNASLQIQTNLQCCFLFPNISTNERLQNEDLGTILDSRMTYTQFYNDTKRVNKNLLEKRQKLFREILPKTEYAKIDSKHISSIHIHGAYNFLPVYNSLVKMGVESRVVKIFTTHNPYQPAMEDLYLFNRTKQLNEKDNQMMSYYFNERDKWAFTLADCLFFPSEESLEGYYNLWSDFKSLTKNKPIYFCPSGTTTKKPTLTKEAMRHSLNIPKNAKVALYIGRFIDVRGYDLLLEAANIILNARKDIYFVVVGEAQQTPIQHERYMQIPFVNNPSDYINAADVCICPNRGSLFDLSMIEILSLGTPIVAHYVGGYKWVKDKTSGVVYAVMENIDSLVSKINEIIDSPEEKISKMRQDNKSLYDNQLTLECFEKNYSKSIQAIYDDFNISKKQYMVSFCETNISLIENHEKTMLVSDKVSDKEQLKKRKLNKLKNHPILFVKDFLKKRFKK